MYLCGVCGRVVHAETRRRKVSHPGRTQSETGPQQAMEVGYCICGKMGNLGLKKNLGTTDYKIRLTE